MTNDDDSKAIILKIGRAVSDAIEAAPEDNKRAIVEAVDELLERYEGACELYCTPANCGILLDEIGMGAQQYRQTKIGFYKTKLASAMRRLHKSGSAMIAPVQVVDAFAAPRNVGLGFQLTTYLMELGLLYCLDLRRNGRYALTEAGKAYCENQAA